MPFVGVVYSRFVLVGKRVQYGREGVGMLSNTTYAYRVVTGLQRGYLVISF